MHLLREVGGRSPQRGRGPRPGKGTQVLLDLGGRESQNVAGLLSRENIADVVVITLVKIN